MADDKPPIVRIPWKPIEPLKADERISNGSLAALDALRKEWDRRLSSLPESDRVRIRQRSLRRLSVETGMLERLYHVEWGLTLTLVAEGFTRDVVERAGGQVDDRTLATLRAQMDTLEMVLDFVRSERVLTSSFIKELHHAITRTQDTYVITDSLGRIVESQLVKGEWKTQPNHVLRQDNTLLEYTPPEQVGAEIDQLLKMWHQLDATTVHPVIRAAWLHHRFVQIHPFADGNGRVARALTLLVLERHKYAPLVVDRWHRPDYLKALDAANAGSLQELIRLFIKLEGAALTSELERPEDVPVGGMSIDIAHTLAEQLAAAKKRRESKILKSLEPRAIAVTAVVRAWFLQKRKDLIELFNQRGLREVRVIHDSAESPAPKANYFRRQIIESAHTAGHYADFGFFASWSSLKVLVGPIQMRYVASLHGAGRENGIMAITTFGEIDPVAEIDETGTATGDRERATIKGGAVAYDFDWERDYLRGHEYLHTTKDAFRFVHDEPPDQINRRTPELHDLLEEGLAEALTAVLKLV